MVGAAVAIGIVVASVGLAALPAAAQTEGETILYTLEGVTFEDGGAATGQFTFDRSMSCALTCPEAYVDIAVTTTAGSTLPGALYADPTLTEASGAALLEIVVPGTGPELMLTFTAPLGSALVLGIEPSASAEKTPSTSRQVASGRVVGVRQASTAATTTSTIAEGEVEATDDATTTAEDEALPMTGVDPVWIAAGVLLIVLGGAVLVGTRFVRPGNDR